MPLTWGGRTLTINCPSTQYKWLQQNSTNIRGTLHKQLVVKLWMHKK